MSENENMATQRDSDFMRIALEEAQKAFDAGEVPVGAVVVYEPIDKATRRSLAEPRIVARAYNLRETERDASAHAEFIAMREAMKELDAWRLEDCTVYVTLEPCLMCTGLMQQARIARCVFGAYDPKGGAVGSLYEINADERLNHRFDVEGGVCEEDCARILKEFFRTRRKNSDSSTTSSKGSESGEDAMDQEEVQR